MLIGAKISMLLINLGYELTGVLPRGEDAILHAEKNQPDIILLNVDLKDKKDGIETAAMLQQKNIPVIYLTANADEATFNNNSRRTGFLRQPGFADTTRLVPLNNRLYKAVKKTAQMQSFLFQTFECPEDYGTRIVLFSLRETVSPFLK